MRLFKRTERNIPASAANDSEQAMPMPTGFSKRPRIMRFYNTPRLIGRMSVVGEKESKGPVGKYFQKCETDDKMGEKTFERAEIRMFDTAARCATVGFRSKISIFSYQAIFSTK